VISQAHPILVSLQERSAGIWKSEELVEAFNEGVQKAAGSEED